VRALVIVVLFGCSREPPPTAPVPSRASLSGTLVPPRRAPDGRVPVVVFLPPTQGTSRWVAGQYFNPAPNGYAAILIGGSGRPSDYANAAAWANTIARYERQVMSELARFARPANLDTTRVILAGFSMGGDLAWALALRNPTRVAGAIVMGSRASYRSGPADQQLLARHRRRFFFTLGDDEDEARVTGARAAMAMLSRLGVSHRQRRSGSGHAPATAETFAEALRFVLEGSR
jgi:pimeloyl-ACP methyl ester carboxylesterase